MMNHSCATSLSASSISFRRSPSRDAIAVRMVSAMPLLRAVGLTENANASFRITPEARSCNWTYRFALAGFMRTSTPAALALRSACTRAASRMRPSFAASSIMQRIFLAASAHSQSSRRSGTMRSLATLSWTLLRSRRRSRDTKRFFFASKPSSIRSISMQPSSSPSHPSHPLPNPRDMPAREQKRANASTECRCPSPRLGNCISPAFFIIVVRKRARGNAIQCNADPSKAPKPKSRSL